MTEDEIKARVRQTAMFMTKPEAPGNSPLFAHIGATLKQAIAEHGADQVKTWMEELQKELGPVRLARVLEACAAAAG